jgi:hypothetical protein
MPHFLGGAGRVSVWRLPRSTRLLLDGLATRGVEFRVGGDARRLVSSVRSSRTIWQDFGERAQLPLPEGTWSSSVERSVFDSTTGAGVGSKWQGFCPPSCRG